MEACTGEINEYTIMSTIKPFRKNYDEQIIAKCKLNLQVNKTINAIEI